MPFFKDVFKAIGDTVKGKTGVGKALHEVLPFKKARSVVGNVVLGIKKASPIPEIKDIETRSAVTDAVKEIDKHNLKSFDSDQLLSTIYKVRDILDDGKMNSSVDDISHKTKKLIIQVSSAIPLLSYIIYGITSGEWNFGDFLNYVGKFLGLG